MGFRSSYRTYVAPSPSLKVKTGLSASIAHRVRTDDVSTVFGSGDVPVLATPRALAWCEEATMAAIADHMPADETSVGMRVSLDHVKPTLVGTKVTAIAEVERVDGRRITFAVDLIDDTGEQVAFGRVVRVTVNTATFLDRLEAERASEIPTGIPEQIPEVPADSQAAELP